MSAPMTAQGMLPVIQSYLNERWQGVYQNSSGAFIVPNLGRTACFVELSDTHDGRVRIDIRAPILLDVPRSSALFELVALNATSWQFGALSMYEENGLVVEFDYAILADGVSSFMLNYLVQLIASTADDLAPKLQKDFGGRFLL
jgi:hypothetical protein